MNNQTIKTIAIVMAWVGYGCWEYYVQKWADAQVGGGAVIRVDLFLLIPALVGLTIWFILDMRQARKKTISK